MVEGSILRLSHTWRLFAPLAFIACGFVVLFDGVKLLLSTWKLTLVQVLPAVWIWLAMFDLKAHVLHGKSFHVLRAILGYPEWPCRRLIGGKSTASRRDKLTSSAARVRANRQTKFMTG